MVSVEHLREVFYMDLNWTKMHHNINKLVSLVWNLYMNYKLVISEQHGDG